MRRILSLALGGLISSVRAATEQDGILFLFPYSSGLTYRYLDVLNVSWTSPWVDKQQVLWVFCNGGTYWPHILNVTSGDGFELIKIDWASDQNCWFNMRVNENEAGANSDAFTVNPNVGSQETIGQFGTSSSTTATTATTAPGTATTGVNSATIGAADDKSGSGTSGTTHETGTTSQEGANNDGTGSDGLSTGAVAGIAIGAALGGITLAAAAAFMFMRRRNRARNGGDGETPGPSNAANHPPAPDASNVQHHQHHHHHNSFHDIPATATHQNPQQHMHQIQPQMQQASAHSYYDKHDPGAVSTAAWTWDSTPRPVDTPSNPTMTPPSAELPDTSVHIPFQSPRELQAYN